MTEMREFFRIFAPQYCNQTKTNSKALNWYRNKWYYVAAVALLMPVSFCSLMLPIKLMADKNSKYAWPPEECEKFHVMDKL